MKTIDLDGTFALIVFRFLSPNAQTLKKDEYDSEIYVYDDDRDIFCQLTFNDKNIEAEVVDIISHLTPIFHITKTEDNGEIYDYRDNPHAKEMKDSAIQAKNFLESSGFKLVEIYENSSVN